MSTITITRVYKIKRIRQLIARTELFLLGLEKKIAKLQTKLANRRIKLGYLKAKYSGDLDQLPDAELNQLYAIAEDKLSYGCVEEEETMVGSQDIPPPPEPPKKPDLVISEERYW